MKAHIKKWKEKRLQNVAWDQTVGQCDLHPEGNGEPFPVGIFFLIMSIEVQFTYNKLYPFKVHNSMSFNKCVYTSETATTIKIQNILVIPKI